MSKDDYDPAAIRVLDGMSVRRRPTVGIGVPERRAVRVEGLTEDEVAAILATPVVANPEDLDDLDPMDDLDYAAGLQAWSDRFRDVHGSPRIKLRGDAALLHSFTPGVSE